MSSIGLSAGSVVTLESRTLLCSSVKHNRVQACAYDRAMHSKLAMALAENTKVLMAKHKMRQRDLADAAEISQASVGYLLRYRDKHDRHAAVDTVESIAAVFGVPAHMMLVPGYAAGDARNVRKLRAAPEAPKSAPKDVPLDPEAIELISFLVVSSRRGTAKQAAALIRLTYQAVMGGDVKPTRTAILRFIRAA